MKKSAIITASLIMTISLSGCSKSEEKDQVDVKSASQELSQKMMEQEIADKKATIASSPNKIQFKEYDQKELGLMIAKAWFDTVRVDEQGIVTDGSLSLFRSYYEKSFPDDNSIKDVKHDNNPVIYQERLQPYIDKLRKASENAPQKAFFKLPILVPERDSTNFLNVQINSFYDNELKGLRGEIKSLDMFESSSIVRLKANKEFLVPYPVENALDIRRYSKLDTYGTAYIVVERNTALNIPAFDAYPAYLDLIIKDKETAKEIYQTSIDKFGIDDN